MAKQNVELLAFNRGVVSPLALGRVDVKRVLMSAEQQVNYIPRVLGAMSFRPGWGYKGQTRSNTAARCVPFVYANDDTAIIELTSGYARFWVEDALVTRPTVSTAVANGTFYANLNSWTDSDETGGTSAWATGGYMSLIGDGVAAAVREQTVAVAAGDLNKEHALRITIYQGECHFMVGSSAGADDYVAETFLFPGVHSLAFTPVGDFCIKVFSREPYPTLIDSVTVEVPGVLSLPTPWIQLADLDDVRYDQSGDVVFVACADVKPKRIERRSATSWSVVDYITDDGPFLPVNSSSVTITPSALTGSVTLTASKALFKSTHVGALFKIASNGQDVSASIAAENTFTDHIRVTGVGTARAITVTVSAISGDTVTLQRSIGEPGDWFDVTSYTANTTTSYNDALDNQIAYYRIGIKTGGFTAGAPVTVRLTYSLGSITGWTRITAYSSATSVTASVLKALGSLSASDEWYEGAWSDRRGYPSAVAIHESRLFWAGKDKVWGSVTDNYISFDEDYEGDAGPISRSIGSGPVDKIMWLNSGGRLLMGAQGRGFLARSSSLDEPMTPNNFNLRAAASQGSAGVSPVVVDGSTFFVGTSGTRVFDLTADGYGEAVLTDLTMLNPEIGEPGVVRTAVQRRPDARMHCVRSDGKVALLVFDRAEEVKGWVTLETDGLVEDVVVLPGTTEDDVYYIVARTINGSTVRHLEKWAYTSEAVGGTWNKTVDAFTTYSGAATATITGLSHLEGETVKCWAGGVDRGSYTVASGQIVLPAPTVTTAVVGLAYQGRYKSAKLAYAAEGGSALTQVQRVSHLGVMLYKTHAQGLKYGADFDNLDDLPQIENGAQVDQGSSWASYSEDAVEFNGTYDTDSRVCLETNSPLHCTVLALVVGIQTNEKG